MANLYSKTAICLLSFGLALSQTAAFAGDSDLLAAANMPPVKVRATEDSQVLSGHITDNVESLSKDILRDEVKLQRFNLGFRQNNNKQGRWKGWRYFVTQEGNLGLTEAGLIVGAGERGEHVHGSKAANTSHNKLANGGVMLGAIGNIVAGGGSALELGINEYHAIEAEQHGYGSKQARDTAVKLVGEIDNKLIQRKHLIEQQPPADKEIAEMQEMEGAVLNDFRDLAIAEFERFHTSAKKSLAQQNSFYMLDIGKNVTGSVGSWMQWHSILSGFRTFNLSGGILGLVSGGLIMTDPITSRLIGKAVEKADKRNMEAHGLPTVWENGDKLAKDYSALSSFCKNHQVKDRPELHAFVSRMEAYDENDDYCVNELQRNSRALRKGNRTAVQNMGTGFIVGASKIGNATLSTVNGAKYIHDSIRTNSNFFVANVEYIPGVTWGLIDNVRIQVNRERDLANQRKTSSTPGQIIKSRLQQLDTIESKI